MMWAIVDELGIVSSVVQSQERPQNSVKVSQGVEVQIGWKWNGWEFDAPRWTAYEFLNRFTPDERIAYRNAAKTDDLVADFLNLAQAAQEIISNDPMTIAGMDYLVSQGLLTQARRDEILAVS